MQRESKTEIETPLLVDDNVLQCEVAVHYLHIKVEEEECLRYLQKAILVICWT